MSKKISALTNMNGVASIDRTADFIEVSDSSGPTSYRATPNFILGFSGGAPVSTSDTQNLTNKTLDNSNIITARDDRFTLQDSGDVTKQAQFQLSGITAGQTRVYTLPDASDTLVGKATTDTLTNKTISGGAINNATIDNPVLQTDTVSEHTSANGVTVDGLNIKDGALNTNNSVVASNITDGAVTPAKLVAGAGSSWAYQSYTPTFTNLTVGNGTLSGKYTQIGKHIAFYFSLIWGTTTSVSGSVSFTLPVTSVAVSGSQAGVLGTAKFNRSSTAYPGDVVHGSTTTGILRWHQVSGGGVRHANLGATSPDTWVTSDEFHARGTYQAA